MASFVLLHRHRCLSRVNKLNISASASPMPVPVVVVARTFNVLWRRGLFFYFLHFLEKKGVEFFSPLLPLSLLCFSFHPLFAPPPAAVARFVERHYPRTEQPAERISLPSQQAGEGENTRTRRTTTTTSSFSAWMYTLDSHTFFHFFFLFYFLHYTSPACAC